jgi:hypothetical protein
MGDPAPLETLLNESDVERRQEFLSVCAKRGFTSLLGKLLEKYRLEDRNTAEPLVAGAAFGGIIILVI